jgi:hypothetical protein
VLINFNPAADNTVYGARSLQRRVYNEPPVVWTRNGHGSDVAGAAWKDHRRFRIHRRDNRASIGRGVYAWLWGP